MKKECIGIVHLKENGFKLFATVCGNKFLLKEKLEKDLAIH